MAVDFGGLCDSLYKKNEEIDRVNERLKVLAGEKRAIEDELMAAMVDANTDVTRGKKATVSISTTIRPQLKDMDALAPFVYRNKAIHLFERRIAAVSYREMIALRKGKPIPGIDEFPQTRLNIRKV